MKKKLVYDYVLIAVLAPILNITKLAMALIPNVEPITLLIIIYTLIFGFRKTMIITLIFVFIEGLMYGINMYFLQYLFVWPLLVILTYIFKKSIKENFFLWSIFSGAFGVLFGVLSSIPLMIFSETFAYSSIITGLPFDAIHLVGNYFLMLLLGEKIYSILKKYYGNLYRKGGYYENIHQKWW